MKILKDVFVKAALSILTQNYAKYILIICNSPSEHLLVRARSCSGPLIFLCSIISSRLGALCTKMCTKSKSDLSTSGICCFLLVEKRNTIFDINVKTVETLGIVTKT